MNKLLVTNKPRILVIKRRINIEPLLKQFKYVEWLKEVEEKDSIDGIICVLKTKKCINHMCNITSRFPEVPKYGVISPQLRKLKPMLLRREFVGLEELPLTRDKIGYIVTSLLWGKRGIDKPFDSFLREILGLALNTRNEALVLKRIAEGLLKIFSADRVTIMLLGQDSQVLTIRSAVGIPENLLKSGRKRWGEKIAGWVAEKNIPVILQNGLKGDERFNDVKGNRNIKSAMIIPIRFLSNSYGVINFTRFSGEEFSIKERDRACLYGSFIAMIIYYLKELERLEMFNQAIDNSSEGVIILDKTSRILMFSKGAERILGKRADEVMHKSIHEVLNVAPGSMDKIIKMSVKTNMQINYKDSDGMMKVLLISASPVLSNLKAEIGAMVIVRDLTEFIEVQRDKLNVDKINEINKWLEEISHEMNNPLSVILGNIHIVKDVLKDMEARDQDGVVYKRFFGEFKRMMDEINSAGERMAIFVRTLRNFNIDREIDIERAFLRDLIDRAIDIVSVENLRNIKVSRHYYSNPVIRCVRDKFIVLLVTILRDLMDCTKEGERIHITLREENGRVFVEVKTKNITQGVVDKKKGPLESFYSTLNIPECLQKNYGLIASLVELNSGRIEFEFQDNNELKVRLELKGEDL